MKQHLFAVGAALAALTSCASGTTQDEPVLTPASYVQPAPGADSVSDEPLDAQTCISDAECAAGFACSYDPERSQAVRYCLPQ